MAMHHLKRYPTELEREAAMYNIAPMQGREWVWYFLEKAQALKAEKICWPDDNFGNDIWTIAVDGTRMWINEPGHPEWSQDSAYYSHKFAKRRVSITSLGSLHRYYLRDEPGKDWYKAILYGENCVLVTLPAYPYTFLRNRAEMDRSGSFKEHMFNGIDEANHGFNSNISSRELKNLLLRFPEGHTLSLSEI